MKGVPCATATPQGHIPRGRAGRGGAEPRTLLEQNKCAQSRALAVSTEITSCKQLTGRPALGRAVPPSSPLLGASIHTCLHLEHSSGAGVRRVSPHAAPATESPEKPAVRPQQLWSCTFLLLSLRPPAGARVPLTASRQALCQKRL